MYEINDNYLNYTDYIRKNTKEPEKEYASNFPLYFYEYFLYKIQELGIITLTYDDLFHGCYNTNHKSFYEHEFACWRASRMDKEKIYLLIQHDVDNVPPFTDRMLKMEEAYGVKSNVFIFNKRYSSGGGIDESYKIDHPFLQKMTKKGFVVGYHQNAYALANFDMKAAVSQYNGDVLALREFHDIKYVVPHGGAGREVNGKKISNVDVSMPQDFCGNLRWVYNRYGPKFSSRWSDGGLRKARDPERIEKYNIVDNFLLTLKKGTRNFCLVHPQRWGFNVDTDANPLLSKEEWYRRLCTTPIEAEIKVKESFLSKIKFW
ncbi:MAG: hypothetical protein C0603_09955 [Denitrovibrio sp.]|nr:MAG: hypothetical protein C0603_09955 [Denitrovibrio sp.]